MADDPLHKTLSERLREYALANKAPGKITTDYLSMGRTGWFFRLFASCTHDVLLPWRPATNLDSRLKNVAVTGYESEAGVGALSMGEQWKCAYVQLCRGCGGVAKVAEDHQIEVRPATSESKKDQFETPDAWKCIAEKVCARCDTNLGRIENHQYGPITTKYERTAWDCDNNIVTYETLPVQYRSCTVCKTTGKNIIWTPNTPKWA